LAWLLVLASLALGCDGSRRDPELLVVADIGPPQLELGDRVEVVGDGFPEGRPATVELEGDLYRVGDPEVRSYRHSFVGRSAGRSLVAFVPTEAELQELVGSGPAAAHTTFRGRVRVAFSSRQAKAGPVYGTLENVVLDVFPWNVPEPVRQARELEAERFGRFLGVTFGGNGFEVTLVKPGSLAERAGVRGGDGLVALDGVRLQSPSDFFVTGGQPRASLELRRGRLEQPLELSLPVEGFRPVPPNRLAGAALLIAFAAALVLVFRAPCLALLVWIERRIVERTLEHRASHVRGTGVARRSFRETLLARDLLPPNLVGGLLRPVPYFVFLGASAVFAVLAVGQSLVAPGLDLTCLFLFSVAANILGSLLLGGWRARDTWSLAHGIRAAGAALLFQVPAGLGLATAFVHTGTLDARALVSLQGGWPWLLLAFQSPMLLFGCVVLLATGLPESSRRGYGVASLDTAEACGPLGHRVSRSLCFCAEMLHLFVCSGLAVVVLLGGWAHGLDAAGATSLGALLGAAVLQLKTWAVVFCLLGVRWAMSHVARSDLFGFWLRWLLPLSLGGLVLTLGYQRGIVRYALLEQARHGIALVVFLLVTALGLYFAARVVRAIRAGTRATAFSLNPWL
ncbi:MAG TPA: NADH-quinone oxidoreductase subunit H, partial [Polyangiaceae bacterium]|nr:NADH-quinone oxidoreductase subunit H [Polyangiaceae bacterium]